MAVETAMLMTLPEITKSTYDHDFLGEFGRGGEGAGEFIWLSAIALDKDENIYAADEWLNRITVFDKEGKLLTTWGEDSHEIERVNWNPAEPASAQKITLRDDSIGLAEGKLNGPSGLAFDLDGNLLVVNNLNHRIEKFTKDGKHISGFGVHGDGSW
jgi:tripartite motif-containing protein 71